jgi:hypothetical protein
MSYNSAEFKKQFEEVSASLSKASPLTPEEQMQMRNLLSIRAHASRGNTIQVEKRRAKMATGIGLSSEEQVTMSRLMSKKGKFIFSERAKK